MSTTNTQSLINDANGYGKDKHFEDQFKMVFDGFFKKPQSMKMLSVKLNIDRANICWYCRDLRNTDQIGIAKIGLCKITNRKVNFYTTNPELFQQSNQLKMF